MNTVLCTCAVVTGGHRVHHSQYPCPVHDATERPADLAVTCADFATYCPHCGTGDPGEDYCASCGDVL